MLKKDVTKKMLESIATMLNEVMGFKDPILIGKGILRKDLYDEVADVAQDIELGDLEHKSFTDDMVKWLEVMGWENPVEKAEENKAEKPDGKATKPEKAPEPKKEPAKKAGPKKASTTGPGVIASILEFVKEFGPVTKKELVEKLAVRFPDRKPEAMAKTVQVQLPKRMSKEKKVNIVKGDKGFSIESDKTTK